MQHLVNIALKGSKAVAEAKGQHAVLIVTVARAESY
jgi:hypothetical protein